MKKRFSDIPPEYKIIFLAILLGTGITLLHILGDARDYYELKGTTPSLTALLAKDIPTFAPAMFAMLIFSMLTAKVFARHRKTEESLRVSQRNLEDAERIARLGSWVWTIETGDIQWSGEIFRIFGQDQAVFKPSYDGLIACTHPDDRDIVKKAVVDALARRSAYELDHRIILPDSSVRMVHDRGDLIYDEGGVPVRMVGTLQDVTEQRKAEEELRRLSTVIEESINIVIITDAKGKIEYVNPTFERITGYRKDEALSKNPRMLSSGSTTAEDYTKLWHDITNGKSWRGIFRNKRKDGGLYWCNALITPIRDKAGAITHFLAIQEDITEKMLAQKKADYLSTHDETTGLGNRAHTMAALSSALERFKSGTLILVDIDGFKTINDAYGVSFGDRYLKDAAGILLAAAAECCGEDYEAAGGFVGRIGEDEFTVFLPELQADHAMALAELIRRGIEAHKLSGTMISATVTLGVAAFNEDGLNSTELLGRVNAAVYRDKELGGNRSHLYIAEDAEIKGIRTRIMERDRILRALEDGRFVAWHQPIMSLKDDTVTHFESLVRMVDEDGSIRMPGSFIGVAESFGLVGRIDRLMLEKSMTEQAHATELGKDWYFSVNLSGRDMGDETMLEFLKDKSAEFGVKPSRIILEITETAAIHDAVKAAAFMNDLRALGFRFSLDDFGVGFTSFVYLKQLPVDYLKIDGSFVKNIETDPHDRSVVRAIVDIARSVNVQTVAEFVETEEALEILRELGVDFAQGYLIGRPSPELPS